MKCHYTWDKEVGRVLIPGCMPVALSGDISDCICHNDHQTYASFEKERYNEEIKLLNNKIKQLTEDNNQLLKECEEYIEIIESLKKDKDSIEVKFQTKKEKKK